MSEIRPHCMHEAGSIGGVPNPDHQGGLWPGGMTVWVNMDTMEVDHTDLIGGGSIIAPVEVNEEQTPTDPALPAIEASTTEQPALEPTNETAQEAFPQVTPVENLEEINA